MTVATRDLLRILEVARTGSISRAANNLNIAQPALSKTIKTAEERLGFQLFVRTHRGVEPTRNAHVILSRTQAVRAELDRLGNDISALQSGTKPIIRIGAEPVHPADIISIGMLEVSRLHPEVTISVSADFTTNLIKRLCNGNLDFVMGSLPDVMPAPGLVASPIYYEELVIVCGPESPLFEAAEVTPDDLADMDWIAGVGGSASRNMLDHLERALGLPPSRVPILLEYMHARLEFVTRSPLLSIFQRAQVASAEAAGRVRALPMRWPCAPQLIGTLRPETSTCPVHDSYVRAMRSAFAAAGLRIPDTELDVAA